MKKLIAPVFILLVLAGFGVLPVMGDEPPYRIRIIQTTDLNAVDIASSEDDPELSATVGFFLDEEGHADDFVVIEASSERLVPVLLSHLPKWRYEHVAPDGEIHPLRVISEITIHRTGTVFTSLGAHEYWINQLVGSFNGYRVSQLKDLDSLPRPVQLYRPDLELDMVRRLGPVMVRVEFFIDEEGTVRLPGILESTHPELDLAVLNAIWSWKFEPPMRYGKPVVVRAVQPFVFNDSGVATRVGAVE